MEDALFLLPTPQVLQKVITGLEELYEHDIKDKDTLGDLYEYMLSKLNTAGQNGQFRTPKHIRDMMVRLVDPTPDDLICDPPVPPVSWFPRRVYQRKMRENHDAGAMGAVYRGNVYRI